MAWEKLSNIGNIANRTQPFLRRYNGALDYLSSFSTLGEAMEYAKNEGKDDYCPYEGQIITVKDDKGVYSAYILAGNEPDANGKNHFSRLDPVSSSDIEGIIEAIAEKNVFAKLGGENTFQKNNTFQEDVEIQGKLKVGDKGAEISGEVNVGGKLTVEKKGADINGDVTIGGDTSVTGNVTAQGLATKNFVQNATDGRGAAMWEGESYTYPDGTQIGYVETDVINVRRAANFRTINVVEVNHSGGENVLSAAGCQIAIVVPLDDNNVEVEKDDATKYRCFFEKEANGRTVYNEWRENDQAKCQRMDMGEGSTGNTYYWRLVVGVGDGSDYSLEYADYWYVDLSAEDYDHASNAVPQTNDNIVLYGNREDRKRSSAQVHSTINDNAPARYYYTGIGMEEGHRWEMPTPIETMEYDNGAHWRVGNEDSYIEYTEQDGLVARLSRMFITVNGEDKDVSSALDGSFVIWTHPDIDWNAPRENGSIARTIPSASKEPSRSWTDDEKSEHLGDYLVTMDGFAYEYRYESGNYYWALTSDQYLTHAQETADKSQATLADMASDKVITIQEKWKLHLEYERIQKDYKGVTDEASNAGASTTAIEISYGYLYRMLDYLLCKYNEDTPLEKEDGTILKVKRALVGLKIEYSVVYTSDTDSGATQYRDYETCYSKYYEDFANLRKSITEKVKNASDKAGTDVAELAKKYSNIEGGFTDINNKFSLIAAKAGEDFAGLLTTSNYTQLFATDGEFTSLVRTTAQQVTISSSQIVMDGNLGVQGLTYRIPTDITSFGDESKIWNGMTMSPSPQLPPSNMVFNFYTLNVYDKQGWDDTTRVIGAVAFNLAKTGTHIKLTSTSGTDNTFYFVLPCFIGNRNVYARFCPSDSNEPYPNQISRQIVNLFREEAIKYLGNRIVVEIPANSGIDVELFASEYYDNIFPFRVSKGVCVNPPYEGFEDILDDEKTYIGGRGYLDVETAWITAGTTKKYVVMELKQMRTEKNYANELNEENKVDVIGWEITVFESAATLKL